MPHHVHILKTRDSGVYRLGVYGDRPEAQRIAELNRSGSGFSGKYRRFDPHAVEPGSYPDNDSAKKGWEAAKARLEQQGAVFDQPYPTLFRHPGNPTF